MEKITNAKLHLENLFLTRENERLKKEAKRLEEENKALLHELHQKLAAAGIPVSDLLEDGGSTVSTATSSCKNSKEFTKEADK